MIIMIVLLSMLLIMIMMVLDIVGVRNVEIIECIQHDLISGQWQFSASPSYWLGWRERVISVRAMIIAMMLSRNYHK